MSVNNPAMSPWTVEKRSVGLPSNLWDEIEQEAARRGVSVSRCLAQIVGERLGVPKRLRHGRSYRPSRSRH